MAPGLFRALLLARLRGFRNGLTRAGRRERLQARAGLAGSFLLVGTVGLIAYGMLRPLAVFSTSEQGLRLMLDRLPAAGLFSAFWMLLLSGVTVGIQVFYLHPELPMLLAAPVPHGRVVLAKFVEAVFTNAAMFLALAFPIGVAYGLALEHLSPGYIATLAATLLVFAVLPTSIGVTLSFVLMRLLPPTRTRDLLGALGLAIAAGLYLLVTAAISRMGGSDVLEAREQTMAVSRALHSPLLEAGPWAWAGYALRTWTAGGTAPSVPWGLVALSGGAFLAAAGAARQLHLRGWSSSQETGQHGGRAKGVRARGERMLTFLPAPVRGVILKDLLTMGRDMRQLSMLFVPIAVVALFLFNLRANPSLRTADAAYVQSTLLIVLAPVMLRLALSTFVAETAAFWLVLCSPNGYRPALAGKFLVAWCLSLPLASGAVLGMCWAMDLHPSDAALNTALTALSGAGLCAIGVGGSAALADFRTGSPRFALSAGARLLMFAGQALLLLVLLGGQVAVTTLGGMFAAPEWAVALLVTLYTASASAAIGTGWMLWGGWRMRRLEWGG